MRLRGLREATIHQRRNALMRLRRALGHDLLTSTPKELAVWQRHLSLTPAGMATEVSHAACFFHWAAGEGLIPEDPSRKLIRPRRPKRLPRPISHGNLQTAIDCAPRDIRLMLVLAAYCGLRAGELARLQRDDLFDAAGGQARIMVLGKGGRPRVVPMSSYVLMEIRAYGLPSTGVVFRRRDGRPGGMTPSRLSQIVNHYLHDLGIGDTLHAARHWFGTHVYAETPDIRVVQDLMGHNDPATTALYVEVVDGKAVDAVERLAAKHRRRSPVNLR